MTAPKRLAKEAERRAAVWNVLTDLIADHPMWISDDGKPLDYSPEREGRVHDFIAEASEAIAALDAAEKAAVGGVAGAVSAEQAQSGHGDAGGTCTSTLALRWGSAKCDLPVGHLGGHYQAASARSWTTEHAEQSWSEDRA